MMRLLLSFVIAAVFLTTELLLPCTGQDHVGVNYGFNGDNLPSARDVVALYIRCGIPYMRIFEPNYDVLEALRETNILLSLGTRNEDIENLASSQEAANAWVNTYVQPYANDVNFGWITVGNEAIPGPFATFVAQAMTNLHNAVNSIGLSSTAVTTVLSMKALAVSYPPSAGAFSGDVTDAMNNIVQYFTGIGSRQPVSLMVNLYPYFAYASDPTNISLDYATFNARDPVLDGNFKYFCLFDAMVDSVYAALEKINADNVSLTISETGWPSAGNDPYTSKDYAEMYNQNLFTHLRRDGTPRRPGQLLTAFLFEMFNEDQKPAGVEQNFGLFYPNMQPVYPYWTCQP